MLHRNVACCIVTHRMGARRLERPGALDLEAATGLRLVLPGRRIDLEPRREPKVNQVDLGRLSVKPKSMRDKHTTLHGDGCARSCRRPS